MIDFYSHTRNKLAHALTEQFGLESFRADQLFQWVYQKQVTNPLLMTNIARGARELLNTKLSFHTLQFSDRQISRDGSMKYLIPVDQGQEIESVLIAQEKRNTLCVSSQVGCALGCKFCRTGTMGLTRHLSTGEIVKQFLTVERDALLFGKKFSNMVFMGMGEPLHNLDNVLAAIEILADDVGPGFSGRRITVSTVGMVPAIKRFFQSGTQANLAVSLNATTNEIRSRIMPINDRYPIEELLGTLRALELPRRKRVTIEYVMLGGVNDSHEDLKRLPKILEGIPAKLNLIPYNTNAQLGFETPEKKKVMDWQKRLLSQGLVTTIRWSKGQDIDAACGQLRTDSVRARKTPKGLSIADSPSATL
jgi:23S rRNA (adenine2503-C2)-methyltransferase